MEKIFKLKKVRDEWYFIYDDIYSDFTYRTNTTISNLFPNSNKLNLIISDTILNNKDFYIHLNLLPNQSDPWYYFYKLVPSGQKIECGTLISLCKEHINKLALFIYKDLYITKTNKKKNITNE